MIDVVGQSELAGAVGVAAAHDAGAGVMAMHGDGIEPLCPGELVDGGALVDAEHHDRREGQGGEGEAAGFEGAAL